MKKWFILLLTVLILSACSSKAYTESLEAGKTALEKGDYNKAVEKFENALEEKETNEAKDYLQAAENMQESLVLYRKGDFDAAIYTLNKMLTQKSTEKATRIIRNQATALVKEIQEAKILSDSMKERIIKGKTLLEQNQYDQAMEVFKEVSESIEFPGIASIEKLTKDASDLLVEAASQKKSAEQERKKQEDAKKQEDEKQKQEEANKTLTHEQAEELVRQYLNFQIDQNVKVVYDHDADNGDYIIHVYEFVVDNQQTGEGHTATWGWYGVNKQTKVVYDAMQ